jgi:uncharacterized phiE125 gp8 family phage protein
MADNEERLAAKDAKTLVTLMHANNEIGNMIDMQAVGERCKKYDSIFHSDTVQTVGHFPFDLKNTHVHFITGGGHKFHGPKGVGLLYVNETVKIHPFIHGGGQERNMRAGTENLYGIVGFAKALELATVGYEVDSGYMQGLKVYMMEKLKQAFPGAVFVGSGYTYLQEFLPNVAQAAVRAGWTDSVGLGRMMLSYPDLPADVRDPTVTKASTSVYTVAYTPTQTGTHRVRWVATGANASAYQDTFDVTVWDSPVSLTDIRTHLNLTGSTSDEELRAVAATATSMVEARTGPLLRRSITESGLTADGTQVQLHHYPTVSVTTVTESGSTIAGTAYTLIPDAGILHRPWGWSPDPAAVTVTYVAGRSTVPATLRTAVLECVRELWLTQRASSSTVIGQASTEEMLGGPPRTGWQRFLTGYEQPTVM